MCVAVTDGLPNGASRGEIWGLGDRGQQLGLGRQDREFPSIISKTNISFKLLAVGHPGIGCALLTVVGL